jgi:hypothetical protein
MAADNKEKLVAKRTQISRLGHTLAALRLNLKTAEIRLETLKKRKEKSTHRVIETSASTHAAIARFLANNARLAAREIGSGKGDRGRIRDLVKAALFGDKDAAVLLGETTLSASKGTRENEGSMEALAWFKFAAFLEETDNLRSRVDKMEREMTDDDIAEARTTLDRLKLAFQALKADPFSDWTTHGS